MTTLEEFAEILKRDELQAALHRLDGPLPEGWRAMRCNETYLVYFVHDPTRTTTWTDPRWPLPQGWLEKRDPKGVSYFVRAPGFAAADDHPTYTDPRGPLTRQLLMHTSLPLPKTVTVRVDDKGYIFFADAATQTTMWTDPRCPLPSGWVQKRIKASRALSILGGRTLLTASSSDTTTSSEANPRPHVYISFFQNKNRKHFSTFIDPRVRIPIDSPYLLQTTQVHEQDPTFPYVLLVNATTKQPLWHDARDPLPVGWTASCANIQLKLPESNASSNEPLVYYYLVQSAGLAGTSIVLKTIRNPRLVTDVNLMIDDLNLVLSSPDRLSEDQDTPTSSLPTILTATPVQLRSVNNAPDALLSIVHTSAALALTVPRTIAELRELVTNLEAGTAQMQSYNFFAPVIEEPSTPAITPEPHNPLVSDLFNVGGAAGHKSLLEPSPEEDEDMIQPSVRGVERKTDPERLVDPYGQMGEFKAVTSPVDAKSQERSPVYPRPSTNERDPAVRSSYSRPTATSAAVGATSTGRRLVPSRGAAAATNSVSPQRGLAAGVSSSAAAVSAGALAPRPSLSATANTGSVVHASFENFYQKEAKLDRGAFGTVWRVRRISDGKEFVMKEMDLTRADHEQKRIAKQEGQLHSMLNDPYIVKHEKTFVTPNFVYVVMEYCPRGSLWDLIANRRSNFATLGYWTEDQVMWWLVQLIQAVAHIHSLNIVHLDIKPANMLLANDWSIRLCDFGLSVFTNSKRIHIKDTFAGTPAYASPEQMQGQPPDQKTDVWAVGVILYILCTLVPPFGDLTAKAGPIPGKMGVDETHQFHALRKRILTSQYPPLPEHFSKELNALLARLLAKKARFRPTMQEVLEMPFIQMHLERQGGHSSQTVSDSASNTTDE